MSALATTNTHLFTIRDFILWGEKQFASAGLFFGHGTDNALDEAAALILKTLEKPYDLPESCLDSPITEDEKAQLFNVIEKRINERKPVAYLTGEALFAGLAFFVDERVLVPRSPLAELISERFSPWIKPDKVRDVLDLCTGSGCIAIACSYAFPEASVDAADLSEDALAVCSINIDKHKVGERVKIIHSNLFDDIASHRYDIIVSNPPYVSQAEWEGLPNEFHHEPDIGFRGGESGLDLVEQILDEASSYLKPGGILVVEVGRSAEALMELFPSVAFCWLEFEFGGDGVFLLTAEQLVEYQPLFRKQMETRK